jgi:sugar lactone lactonase YvrE
MLKCSPLLVSNVLCLHSMRCMVASLCGLLLVMSGIPEKARAQTAHFSGAQTYVDGGGVNIFSIAVDGKGDVFFTVQNGSTQSGGGGSTLCAQFADSGSTTWILNGFTLPTGLAADSSGNLYILDSGAGKIDEIAATNGSIPETASPTVITVATGINSTGDLAIDNHGDIFFTSVSASAVEELVAVSGVIPPSPIAKAIGSGFRFPVGITVDTSGNLFVGDTFNNAVKEVLAVNGSIPASPTILTLGSGFLEPEGLAIDKSGNLYVSDYGNNALKQIQAVNGSIPSSPTVVNLGPYSGTQAVAVDSNNLLYVGDIGSNSGGSVLKVSLAGGTFAPTNVGSSSQTPISIAFTFDAASTLGSVSVLTQGASGLDFLDAGSGSCKANTAYSSGQTCTVSTQFMPRFAGTRIGAVVLNDSTGNVIATGYLQGTGVGPQVSFLPGTETVIRGVSVSNPHGIAVDGKGNIYVSDDNSVEKETYSNGSYTQTTIASGFVAPNLIAVDGAGNLYITELNKAVWKETPAGSGYTQRLVDSGFGFPYGVAIDGAGNVFIADPENGQILKETPSAGGYIRSTVVSGLSNCVAVAVDAVGNLYIAEDSANATGTILKETLSNGTYTQTVLPVQVPVTPYSIIVDGTGNVYFADAQTYNVYKETPTPSGYVESAVVTDLHDILGPYGLAVDGSGKMYIAYLGGHSVVVDDFADPPSLGFASTPVGSTSADSPQTVTLTNIGNADLTFPIPASGTNPSITTNFTLDENAPSACPVTGSGFGTAGVLSAGSSCELPISFAPTTVGSLSGSLVLTDDNLNTPAPAYSSQTIKLSGISTAPVPAVMISPAPGGTLTSPITTFTWTTGSAGTTTYYLWVGTSFGTNNLVNMGLHTTSLTVTLPTNGATLYVRLWSVINGVFEYNDYVYTESSVGRATLVSPAPGSTLAGPVNTFTWTTGPAGTTTYYLWVGTSFGTNNLVNIGLHTTSLTVTLPTTGATLYVRLWSVINGVFVYQDYTYTEASVGRASLVSPAPGSTLAGPVNTFTWTTGPAGTTTYYLWVGTSFGTNNLVNMGLHTTSLTVTLPTNGATLYVRLWSVINGVFVYQDYTYTEFNAGQAMVIAPPSEPGRRRNLFLDGA